MRYLGEAFISNFMVHRWHTVGVGLAALGWVVGGAAFPAFCLREASRPVDWEGLKVEGEPMPVGQDPVAFVEARATEIERRVLTLELKRGGDVRQVRHTLAELGITMDRGAVAGRLRAAEGAPWLQRRELSARLRKGEVSVDFPVVVDGERALGALAPLKELYDIPPISARYDFRRHGVEAERPGEYVDMDASLSLLRRVAKNPEVSSVTLPALTFAPRMNREYVERVDVKAGLADYETYFSRRGDQSRRGRNIEVAAAKLDGLVLAPRELASFNDTVGERSEGNGFEKSWEIFKGEMVEGVGGGTCQVASTFYAAAFFAGLEVVERLPHSRPSAYIPMGLDATVVYPFVDLKLRNPYPFPVVVHTEVLAGKVKVAFFGERRLAHVTLSRELVETKPFGRKVVVDDDLPPGRVVHKQHGIQGYRMKLERKVRYSDGRVHEESTVDFYPPTHEIYKVPLRFDETLLPPLQLPPDPDAIVPETPAGVAAGAVAAPSTGAVMPVSIATPSSIAPGALAETEVSPGVRIVEAPGAHPPTEAQASPPKLFKLVR